MNIDMPNTINNSNTKHFCRDCGNSVSACKGGAGDYLLPCHLLRKIAKVCSRIYVKYNRNENNLIPDFWSAIEDWAYNKQYLKWAKKNYADGPNRDIILLSMSVVVNCDGEPSLEFVNEYSGDINLSRRDKKIVKLLSAQIQAIQQKIWDEWVEVPANNEYYQQRVDEILGRGKFAPER